MAELEPTVLLAHSPRPWMQEVHFFLVDHGGALVQGYVLSADDALAGEANVLVVDDICSFLTKRLVADLHQVGIRVLGVFDAEDGDAGSNRIESLGVDVFIQSDSAGEAFLAAITQMVDTKTPIKSGVSIAPDQLGDPSGPVVAVAAAGGGTGATEVAIGVATSMQSARRSVALVDADEVTPSVAQRLGLPLLPDLRTAVESVVHGSGSVVDSMIDHSSGVRVVCGLSHPAARSSLRSSEVVSALREIARTVSTVVVNVSPAPVLASRRRDITGVRAGVVLSAEAVVLVGVASPVGVARMADWLASASQAVAGPRLHLVVNRFPGGGYRSSQIVAELFRLAEPQSVTVVPFDRRVQRAEWRGVRVGRGPFRKAVRRIISHIDRAPKQT